MHPINTSIPDANLIRHINFRLALLDCPGVIDGDAVPLPDMATALLSRHRETARLLASTCPRPIGVSKTFSPITFMTPAKPSACRAAP